MIFPCVGNLAGRWFPPNEKSTAAALATSGNQVNKLLGRELCHRHFLLCSVGVSPVLRHLGLSLHILPGLAPHLLCVRRNRPMLVRDLVSDRFRRAVTEQQNQQSRGRLSNEKLRGGQEEGQTCSALDGYHDEQAIPRGPSLPIHKQHPGLHHAIISAHVSQWTTQSITQNGKFHHWVATRSLEQFIILKYALILPVYSNQIWLKFCIHIGLNKI